MFNEIRSDYDARYMPYFLLIWDDEVKGVSERPTQLDFDSIPEATSFYVAAGVLNEWSIKEVVGLVAECECSDLDATIAYITSPMDGKNRMVGLAEDPRALIKERLRVMFIAGDITDPANLHKVSYIESRSHRTIPAVCF